MGRSTLGDPPSATPDTAYTTHQYLSRAHPAHQPVSSAPSGCRRNSGYLICHLLSLLVVGFVVCVSRACLLPDLPCLPTLSCSPT